MYKFIDVFSPKFNFHANYEIHTTFFLLPQPSLCPQANRLMCMGFFLIQTSLCYFLSQFWITMHSQNEKERVSMETLDWLLPSTFLTILFESFLFLWRSIDWLDGFIEYEKMLIWWLVVQKRFDKVNLEKMDDIYM